MAEEPEKKARRRTRGEGGLYERTSTWTDAATGKQVTYTYFQATREVPRDKLPPGMNRKRITGNGRTPTEARKRLQERWDEFHSPTKTELRRNLGVPRRSFQEVYEEWQAQNELGRVSETMAYKYRGYFENHLLPALGSKRIDKVTDDDLLILFQKTLPAKRRLSTDKDGREVDKGQLLSTAATRNIWMALSGCMKYAVRKGYLNRSPMEGLEAPKRQRPVDDIDVVIADAWRLLEVIGSQEPPDRARWLFQFLGLRRAERLGLRWANVRGLDSESPSIYISDQLARWAERGKGWYLKPETKTSNPRRIVLSEPFVTVLRRHKAAQDEWKTSEQWQPEEQFADLVFLRGDGSFYTLNRDNLDWHRFLANNGFEHWRGHLNRHITATWLAEQDPPVDTATVQSILGHKSEAMTHYYARLTDRRQMNPMKRYGEMLLRAMHGEER